MARHVTFNETIRMGEVMLVIVRVHKAPMDKHSVILTLEFEGESNIVPMGWPLLFTIVLCMPEVGGKWEWQVFRFQRCHFSFEVLILASIIPFILVHSQLHFL